MSTVSSRRSAIKTIAGSAALLSVPLSLTEAIAKADSAMGPAFKGKIKHSVARWCYDKIPLEDLCREAKKIGITSIELQGPEEWPVLKKHGLTCAMPWGAGMGIEKGWNDPALHDELIKSYEAIFLASRQRSSSGILS